MSSKRSRPNSPDHAAIPPMVEGLTSQGFLSESHRILEKYKNNPVRAAVHTDSNLDNAGAYIMESSGGISGEGFRGRVQFCRTLFETIAAATNTDLIDGVEGAKLKSLFEHAMAGLNMIDGDDKLQL